MLNNNKRKCEIKNNLAKYFQLEIYNEKICDLLSTNRMTTQDGGFSKYNIKHDANGNTHVCDLIVVEVTSINEVSSLLRRAAQSRLHLFLFIFSFIVYIWSWMQTLAQSVW
jgi:hypothetical protein